MRRVWSVRPMTTGAMIAAYVAEIEAKGAKVPDFSGDPIPMQIAKLQDAAR